jgi:hypothetical protein
MLPLESNRTLWTFYSTANPDGCRETARTLFIEDGVVDFLMKNRTVFDKCSPLGRETAKCPYWRLFVQGWGFHLRMSQFRGPFPVTEVGAQLPEV